MSRPAKKYPFRVFLLTLHDDWQTKQLVFQRLWMGMSRPHLRLSPRCPQPGWEESRLIWRWRLRSWRTDAGRRSWRWSWTSSKFAIIVSIYSQKKVTTHTKHTWWTPTQPGSTFSHNPTPSKDQEACITLTLDSWRNFRTHSSELTLLPKQIQEKKSLTNIKTHTHIHAFLGSGFLQAEVQADLSVWHSAWWTSEEHSSLDKLMIKHITLMRQPSAHTHTHFPKSAHRAPGWLRLALFMGSLLWKNSW